MYVNVCVIYIRLNERRPWVESWGMLIFNKPGRVSGIIKCAQGEGKKTGVFNVNEADG